MAKTFRIQSACECQALLEAELDEHRHVVGSQARRPGSGATPEPAPANAVGASAERFDVVWQCPFCGRGTLRTFFSGALERIAS